MLVVARKENEANAKMIATGGILFSDNSRFPFRFLRHRSASVLGGELGAADRLLRSIALNKNCRQIVE